MLVKAETFRAARDGWQGMSPQYSAFLDLLITSRELGYNMCWQQHNYDRYASLPEWAQRTLVAHSFDPRQYHYETYEFKAAATYDDLWNSAQTQLVQEGRMHNYLRMLLRKKSLEWSAFPRDALTTMVHLTSKYSVDGRNPNSCSGIIRMHGRYDRAWGPERPAFVKGSIHEQ
jgi:deoxyribodipyrimidine photo-lyase